MLACVLALACGTEGERASSWGADPPPPPGEEWSTSVSGLYFYGPRSYEDRDRLFSDRELWVTAVGGTQEIDLVPVSGELYGTSADTANPAIATAGASGESATLSAHAPGRTTLRVRDGRGALIDQVQVRTAEVTSWEVRPARAQCAVGVRCPDPGDALALWSAGDTTLVLRLRGGTGELVDSSAAWSLDGERLWGDWDHATLGPEHFAERTSVRLELRFAGASHDLELPVVSAVDELRVQEDDRPIVEDGELTTNAWTGICVDAYSEGRFVSGVPVRYEVEPPLELSMVGVCGYVRFTEEGEAEVTVRAGDAALRIPLRSAPPGS